MKKSILTVIILCVITAFGCQQSSGQQLKKYDPKRKMSKTPAEWKKNPHPQPILHYG